MKVQHKIFLTKVLKTINYYSIHEYNIKEFDLNAIERLRKYPSNDIYRLNTFKSLDVTSYLDCLVIADILLYKNVTK